jgi:hypothetical protein
LRRCAKRGRATRGRSNAPEGTKSGLQRGVGDFTVSPPRIPATSTGVSPSRGVPSFRTRGRIGGPLLFPIPAPRSRRENGLRRRGDLAGAPGVDHQLRRRVAAESLAAWSEPRGYRTSPLPRSEELRKSGHTTRSLPKESAPPGSRVTDERNAVWKLPGIPSPGNAWSGPTGSARLRRARSPRSAEGVRGKGPVDDAFGDVGQAQISVPCVAAHGLESRLH